jgi:TfuA protein
VTDQRPTPPTGFRTVVFASDRMRALLDRPGIETRPPATRGDLVALLGESASKAAVRPIRVGIIDGTTKGPCLPPKEVMQALSAGIRMYGAVSDGALRAAECAAYGMTGVGRIYQHAAAELVTRIDEYMMPTSPDPTDQSLAAWRIALDDGVEHLDVSEDDARAFVTLAQQMPWPVRTLSQISAAAEASGSGASVRRVVTFLATQGRGVMWDDGAALAEAMLADD